MKTLSILPWHIMPRMFLRSIFRSNLFASLVAAILCFTSCQKKDLNNGPENEKKPLQKCACENETAFPEVKGEFISLRDKNNQAKLTLIKKYDKYILGGDMILSEAQFNYLKAQIEHPDPEPKRPNGRNTGSANRTGINTLANLWTNRTVFYTIHPNLPDQWRVTDAINHWQNQTNIVFVPRTNQPNYIQFTPGTGCSSPVGMQGGMQQLILAAGCTTGNAIHEIGHALGLFHEQMRADRNNFINIHTANIDPNSLNNFETYSVAGYEGFEFGTFDFGSIMMYGSDFFSINGQPTITRLDGSTITAQRIALSAGDIETYNYLYNPPFFKVVTTYSRDDYDWDNRGSYWREWTTQIFFYADANLTIPISLPWQVKTRCYDYNTYQYPNITFPANQTSYNLGAGWHIEIYDSWGNLQNLSMSGLELLPGVGYNIAW